MLLKNMLKINVANEERHYCERCAHKHSTTLIYLYKTIWKLKYLKSVIRHKLKYKYEHFY